MNAIAPLMKTLKVAIVGSGPSGFYAAEALLRSEYDVAVDVYEKLPAPYGLVRYGVAPDHPKLKLVANVFDRIAQISGFRFVGNVCIGKDISVDILSRYYHAVIFACGAECEKDLGITGESLKGSHSAREFVAWYNGHPEYSHLEFDFSNDQAVIIGQGNVALDVARILSKTTDELCNTDIADYALEALSKSQIKNVFVIGRRGPVQAKFSDKELREFGELKNCQPLASVKDLKLNAASKQELLNAKTCAKCNIELLQGFIDELKDDFSRFCHFRFFESPVEIAGKGSVERVVLAKNTLSGEAFNQQAIATGEKTTLECGLVFRCIGYQAAKIPGLFYSKNSGVLNNKAGRLTSKSAVISGLYATGWVKRGANGIIGSNRADSVETVAALLDDRLNLLTRSKLDADDLLNELRGNGHKFVNYSDWKKIDEKEISRGASGGRPRNKFTNVSDMLSAVSVVNV